jgi:hypothetical protein
MSKTQKLKVTIYANGMFGVRAIEAYLISHGTRKYAQYSSAPFVQFTPKGKRKAMEIQESSHCSLLIVAGWDQPSPTDWLEPTEDDNKRSRYGSCDPRWQTDFNELIAKHTLDIVADYRGHNSHDPED